MTMQGKTDLLKALAVTAELTGTNLSQDAARIMAEDLSEYPVEQVLVALTRCRREMKGRLSVAEVINRIADGRPGPEEAWAMIPPDEEGSVVWTEDMAQAFGVAWPLMREGDRIAARMAFKEAYARIVTDARANRIPIRWTPSLGRNAHERETALQEAISKGRLSHEHVDRFLPPPEAEPPRQLTDQMQKLRLKMVQ